ncbi:MAG: hypothetical protein KY466_13195, partial [Gemmatimonadetes bacterium]|nr:hypothetical protein [Gemmatimonadota bacterium]
AGSHLAMVGKGRALLDLGRYSEAAAAVSSVPTTFVHYVQHSVSGTSNGIYALQANGRYSQSDDEGGNGLPFRSSDDPRTPWFDDGGGFDPSYPLYVTEKYDFFDTPIVLASGAEARLIKAENELAQDNYLAMNATLNALRLEAETLIPLHVPGNPPEDATLEPLPVPLTPDAAIDQLFAERAFWMFLTGHRLGDLRRLMYQYGRAEDQVYPTGDYHKGGTYGDDVVFPIDFDETNNPGFELEMCDVTQADITTVP